MDIDNLSPQQLQKAFKLCDIMSLQDVYVASTILQNYQWNVQKAIDEIVYSKQQQVKKQQQLLNPPQPVYVSAQDYNDDQDPYKINDGQDQQQMIDYADYEYEYAQSDIQKKKRMFEESYISELKLNKTQSETHEVAKQLQKDKLLANDYHFHRHHYQTTLLNRSQEFCNRIMESKKGDQNYRNLYKANQDKISLNKKFIVYLHKVYKSKINFTFGTFMLNLIRSYLDDKYLVVFILHEDSTKNGQKVVEKLLTQPEIAKFVNNNCISYGMFDNSDDYEIVQKYVPLKDLPAFAIFKYNKKEQKQQFISSYPILSNDDQNCLEWMAKNVGVQLKKKETFKKSQQKIANEVPFQYQTLSDILKEQNLEYEQIQKLYHMKRLQSRANKDKIKQKQARLVALKQKFNSIVEPQSGSSNAIQIKFRMPITGASKMRTFNLDDTVQIMFDYIEAYCQNQFEEPFCDFDLTQTFPTLSLKDKRDKQIRQIFEDSNMENVIVKEV